MCLFLGFTDSELQWGGGVIGKSAENRSRDEGDIVTFESDCVLFSTLAN